MSTIPNAIYSRKEDVSPVDFWRADTETRIINRQTDTFSFSVPVYPSTAYILLSFDEHNNGERWTAETFNNYLKTYINDRNRAVENAPTFLINYYQMLCLSDSDNIIKYKPNILDKVYKGESNEANPDFYATLGGQYRVSFEQKSGVTLPKLPQGIVDLFECNQIGSKISRHRQQPYKKYDVTVVDDGYTTNYMAVAVINTVTFDGTDYTPVTVDTGNHKLSEFFELGKEGNLFTSVQNLGYLINDIEYISEYLQYYNISLLGNNKLSIKKNNG